MAAALSPHDHLQYALAIVRAIDDPVVQAQQTTALLEALRAANEEARAIRIDAVQTLYALGWGYQRIGEAMGIGKARAQQLVAEAKRGKRPGVIESQAVIAAAETRATGASEKEVAAAVAAAIRKHRGSANITAEQAGSMVDVEVELMRKALAAEDALKG
jgi:hypothetical protein